MLKIKASEYPYWLAAVVVIFLGNALSSLLIFVKNPKLDSQTQLEQKTRQAEILLNDFMAAERKERDKHSGERLVNRSFYKLPPAVEAVRQKSIVGVRVVFPRFNFLKGVGEQQIFSNAGIVINDAGGILTAGHTFGESMAEWFSEGASIWVYDDDRPFDAELIKIDPITDLAELKVKDPKQHVPSFSKKSAYLASVEEKERISDFHNFYAFGFSLVERAPFYWPHILGPYLIETNAPNSNLRKAVFGAISATALEGLSGSVLIAPDGKIYGIGSMANSIYFYFVTVEEIRNFMAREFEEIEKRLFEQFKN